MDFQPYTINRALNSVLLASTTNIDGFYYNGPSNNGVEAYINLGLGSISIDGVQLKEGMEILLLGQTNQNENGIYICLLSGGLGNGAILKRREDFHCAEQLRAGQYLTVGSGNNNSGCIYTLVEPVPTVLGIDNLTFKISNSAPLVRDYSLFLNSSSPGGGFALNANMTDTAIINQPTAFLTGLNGRIFTPAPLSAQVLTGIRGGVFTLGGEYTVNSGVTCGVYSSLHMNVALPNSTTINGGEIAAFYGLYEFRADFPTDISKFSGCALVNITNSPFGQFYRSSGIANYWASIEDPNTNTVNGHVLNAGTAAGSAGDPTKCNADIVVKMRINNVTGYMPIFISNS